MKELERDGEEGSALVIVIILIVGILGMLTFLFTMGQSNTRSQTENRVHLDVDMALRSASADGTAEIKNAFDLTNGGGTLDGLGAKGTLLVGGTATGGTHGAANHINYGIALVVSGNTLNNFKGRTLARYMTTIDKSGLPNVLTMNVVAAYPNFATNAGEPTAHIVKGAKIAFRPSFIFGDRNAVTFAGGMEVNGGGQFGITDSHEVNLQIDEPTDTYPAINVSSSALAANTNFVSFIDDIIGLGGYSGIDGLAGTSPYTELADPSQGDGSGSGWDTISGYPSDQVQLNQTVLTGIANDYRSFYETGLLGVNVVALKGNDAPGRNFTNPIDGNGNVLNNLNGTNSNDPATETFYVFDRTANVDGVAIVGTGTLVMDDDTLTFKNGGSLNWNGNVIIYGDGSPSAALMIENADVNITGRLILVPDPAQSKRSNLKVEGSTGASEGPGISHLKVTGAIIAVAAGSSECEIHFTSSSNMEAPRVEVDGILMTLGAKIDFLAKGSPGGGSPHKEYPGTAGDNSFGPGTNGSEHMTHFNVRGSMIIAGPSGSTLQKLAFDKHTHTRLIFDNQNYEDALDGIKEISPSISTWVQAGYYELGADRVSDGSARTLLKQMLTNIDTASTDALVNYNLGQ